MRLSRRHSSNLTHSTLRDRQGVWLKGSTEGEGAHQMVLAISWGLKWGMVRAAVVAAASISVLPGWWRRVAKAHVALLMS